MATCRSARSRIRGTIAVALTCLAIGLPVSALAADYPSRPIRILVGFSPGGAIDTLARLIAQKMGEKYGHTAFVENRAGANANIAAEYVARARPDGYTLLMVTTSHSLSAVTQAKANFDPINSFTPIMEIAEVPNVVLVHSSLGVSTLQDFIKLAKAAPGKYNFASTEIGGATHWAGESFKQAAGVDLFHVAYQGAGPALTALLSGQVQAYFGSVSAAKSYVASGQVRALAVPSAKRSAVMPEVPTSAEAGLPDYRFSTWYGLLAPAKTPPEIVAKIHDEVKQIMELPEVRERLDREGAEAAVGTSDAFRDLIKDEIARLGIVAKKANVTVK